MLRDVVRTLTRRAAPAAPGSVGELVFSGPLPPARTGVATYDRAVLDGLRRIGFFDRHRMDVLWPIEPKHAPRLPGYRLGVFELGNNVEFHLEAYRAAFLAQVVADRACTTWRSTTSSGGCGRSATRSGSWRRVRPPRSGSTSTHRTSCATSRCESRGARTSLVALAASSSTPRSAPGTWRRPAVARPSSSCRIPSSSRRPTCGARSIARPSCAPERAAKGMRSLVVAPGDLNQAKRLDAVLAAAHELDDDVHVVLVGRRIEGYDVDAVVDAARLGDRVVLASDVSDDDFRGWLAAADVVVDLRFPHRGEVSGSLIRAMQAGKASIVSATGTYLDVPDDAVLRVAPGPTSPGELAERIRSLLADPDLRARMGEAARAHVDAVRTSEATAKGYEARDRGDPAPGPRPRSQGPRDLGQGARRPRRRRGRPARRPRCGLRASARHLPRNVIEPPESRGHPLLDSNAPRLTCASTRGATTSRPH